MVFVAQFLDKKKRPSRLLDHIRSSQNNGILPLMLQSIQAFAEGLQSSIILVIVGFHGNPRFLGEQSEAYSHKNT